MDCIYVLTENNHGLRLCFDRTIMDCIYVSTENNHGLRLCMKNHRTDVMFCLRKQRWKCEESCIALINMSEKHVNLGRRVSFQGKSSGELCSCKV